MMFKLRVPAADLASAEAACERISELAPAPLAVTLFEELPRWVVEAYYDREPRLAEVAGALTPLGKGLGGASLEPVPDLNWVALSQAALPPVRAGRFIVHGSHDRARLRLRRHAIEIEAGAAFGTGHNATTTLCLEAIDGLTRTPRFARVLDLGCGTALLGIAAARALPAARVIASDNDPVATAAARENVQLNRVAARVRVLDATGFGHPLLRRPNAFDLILANILPGPLIELAPGMRRALSRGGIAVLCGLLSHQAREVRGVYLALGFRLVFARSEAGWTALGVERV